jgi:hypothetical protein
MGPARRMVDEYVRAVPNFPLLSTICSRPELYFVVLLAELHFHALCRREGLSVDA